MSLKRITFSITQSDIDSGKKHNCYECPIALAVKRRLKKGFDSTVSHQGISIFGGQQELPLNLFKPDIMNFIYWYDKENCATDNTENIRSERIKPFTISFRVSKYAYDLIFSVY